MLQWKIFMVMALIGHILCGVSDCFLTYAPNGKVGLTNFLFRFGKGRKICHIQRS